MSEIQAIIRQITASVSFLPLLNEPCTFDLLVYTNKNIDTPKQWEESDAKLIVNSQEVSLRSFTTKVRERSFYLCSSHSRSRSTRWTRPWHSRSLSLWSESASSAP